MQPARAVSLLWEPWSAILQLHSIESGDNLEGQPRAIIIRAQYRRTSYFRVTRSRKEASSSANYRSETPIDTLDEMGLSSASDMPALSERYELGSVSQQNWFPATLSPAAAIEVLLLYLCLSKFISCQIDVH